VLEKFKKTFVQFVLFCFVIFLVVVFLPGFYVSGLFSAFVFSLVVAFFNFLLWPFLLRWLGGFLVVTFGVGCFLVSAGVMWLSSIFVPGVELSGVALFWAPVVVGFGCAGVSLVLNIEDDEVDAWQVHSLLRWRTKRRDKSKGGVGFVFVEIDGLSEAVLREAILRRDMPTLAGWLGGGSHKIRGWETDLSSQTSASQAGILHGCNRDIVAFRWVDKLGGNRIVVSNGLNDVPKIQQQISNGKGLLSVNGSSVVNLFSGDAKDKILVYSGLRGFGQFFSESWAAFYSRPFNVAQVLVLLLAEFFFEIRSRVRQGQRKVVPRLLRRGFWYFFARGGANVLLREISTYTVIGEVIGGEKDVVYTTFFGYDEVAHHCGVGDEECFNVLRGIDKRIRRIAAAAEHHSNRRYHICILSDHGQTNGATFKQRYGVTLGEYVEKFLPPTETLYQELNSNQDHYFQILTAPYRGIKGKLTQSNKTAKLKKAGVIVLASGNLGLIYFTKHKHRLTWEKIDAMYPGLVPGLAAHRGIGFVILKTKTRGTVALNAKGKYYLSEDKIEGENPLAKYGKHAATHLRRTDSFNHVPDIMVMSCYDTKKDETAAFEELIGSHGGLGGNQSKPFILHPTEWNLPEEKEEEIVGAEKIYQLFKTITDKEQTNKS
jgi:uncharacterized membrane protein YvlD (DUF360 family)